MKILLAGGTGLIGSRLIEAGLKRGYAFVLLTRSSSSKKNFKNVIIKEWDPTTCHIDISSDQKFDAAINLSGENIASGRWTQRKKKLLLSSRIESTRCIVNFLEKLDSRPDVFINASAIGYYQPIEEGSTTEDSITEESAPGSKFISQICKEWEKEARKAESPGLRCIQARIGVVLSPRGGALKKILLPFLCGFGGTLGSGKQFMSWISLDDVISALLFCLESREIQGPVNLCSPTPISNFEFTKTLGKALKRPTIFGVPAPLLKLFLGEMADQLLLSSLPVTPEKLLLSGFEFRDKDLHETLDSLLSKKI